MLFKGIPKIRPRSIHPAGELQDKYLFIWKVQIKPRYTFGNGAIPTGNSRPSNYFKNKPTSKDILIQIFHTKKGKVVAINLVKNGYMVTMIAGKEPTIVKDGNCLPSSEK